MELPETRQRERLLYIDFRKRETFAYACEAYSRILEAGSSPQTRVDLPRPAPRSPTSAFSPPALAAVSAPLDSL